MKTMFQRGRVAVILAAFGLLMVAGPVSADERTCRGTIGAATVDGLRVPQGATCTLQGTTVKGTIASASWATSRARMPRRSSWPRVPAWAAASRSSRANRRRSSSRVIGDIQFDDNGSKNVARRNLVGGSVQAFQNDGGVAIFGNRIDGNLQCKENSPRPTGGGNIVGGNKEDQCRGF